MELKRYVLTEDNLIHDTNNNLLRLVKEERLQPMYFGYVIKPYRKSFYLFNVQRDGRLSNYPKDLVIGSRSDLGKIKKTSDNILDLVEVGDLILLKNKIQEIFNVGETTIVTTSFMLSFEEFTKETTKIFKKQPNGDFKLYKVKE